MNVLVACEESQRVCISFRDKGHNAFSCDLLKCSGGHPEWHILGDVTKLLNGNCGFCTLDDKVHFIDKWDLIIAFPPCTYLSKAGARWLYPKGKLNLERFEKGFAARQFFDLIYNSNCDKVVIENPIPLSIFELPAPFQIIQPYFFGEPFRKTTCLWGRGVKPLKSTCFLKEFVSYIPSNTSRFCNGLGKGSKGVAANKIDRSKTFWGVARAMAEQWG